MVCGSGEKRKMKISVTLLGLALLTVMTAYLVFGDTNDESQMATIQLAVILFRHGDRTPTELYPNDPHQDYNWPGGMGALTQTGCLQLYNLGKNMRKRYYKLLPTNGQYNKDHLNVLSSYADRCLMSAECFMAGYLPPLANQNKLPINWQPVPIHSMPRHQDTLIAQKKPCRKYDELLKNFYDHPDGDLQELNERNEELYKYLTKHTGQNISNVRDVEFLYNTLQIENDAGLSLPKWTTDVYPDKLLPLAKRNLALITETEFMKKIKGGALLTDILNKMEEKELNNLRPNQSMFVYSGHDVTLVNLMRTLGILNQTDAKPEYGASVVFELHDIVMDIRNMEIRIVYYFNSKDEKPKLIRIPSCGEPCLLSNFSKIMDDFILRDYEEECK